MPVGMEEENTNSDMKLCSNSTWYARVAVGCLGVAILTHLASVGTSYWIAGAENGEVIWHEGLWQSCYIQPVDNWMCVSYVISHHVHTVPGWFKASQTMAVLAIVTSFPAFVMMLLYTLLPTLGGRKIASVLSTVLSIASGICVLSGVIVFSTSYPNLPEHATQDVHYHWSFGVGIVAAILFFVPSALLFVDMRKTLLWIV